MKMIHRYYQKTIESVGANVERLHEDSYGPVDFRVNSARIQDKVFSNQNRFNLRREGKYPYNSDDIDILQITNIDKKTVYAIPMRIVKSKLIESTFSSIELMKSAIRISEAFKERFQKYLFDLNVEKEIQAYITTCEKAKNTPQLTDINFYQKMIDENSHLFGSLK